MLKKKGFPDPCWFYQNSGSEWLAVVLAAQVPKDNLLQNPLCWLRLRTGSKGHKCFAVKLQVLSFYLVLCNAHGFCAVDRQKPSFGFAFLPGPPSRWFGQSSHTILCCVHSQHLQAGSMQEEPISNQCSLCVVEEMKHFECDNRTLNKMARNLQHIFMFEWVLLITSQWHCHLEHHSEIFVLDILQ